MPPHKTTLECMDLATTLLVQLTSHQDNLALDLPHSQDRHLDPPLSRARVTRDLRRCTKTAGKYRHQRPRKQKAWCSSPRSGPLPNPYTPCRHNDMDICYRDEIIQLRHDRIADVWQSGLRRTAPKTNAEKSPFQAHSSIQLVLS